MDLYPSHLGDRLGFEAIRDRLVQSVCSEEAERRALALGPLGREESSRELEYVSALQAVRQSGDALPEPSVSSVAALLSAARPRGAFLDAESLLEIRAVCRSSESVRRFLSSQSDWEVLERGASGFAMLDQVIRGIEAVVADDGSIQDQASQALRAIRRRLMNAQDVVRRALLDALRKASGQGWTTEEQPTIRGGRAVIPVRAEAKRKLKGIVHDMSATGQTAFVEPADCVELNNDVRELEAEERREIVRLLTVATDLVREYADDIRRSEELLVQFDLRRAKALLAAEWDAVHPVRGDQGRIELRGARNPELLVLHQGRPVVPLNLSLGGDHTMVVISGPNAGGKSVAMKTVGLLAYLLGCGIPIPAQPGSRFDWFDRLLGDIGDEQSVEDDLSTFSSRLDRTRQMLSVANDRTLVLIDEAGTGTDPQEGSSLAQAALESIHRAGARVVVTTHHAALKRFAHDTDGAVNAMMRFDQATLRPTYVFEQGVPGASYAFEIAERMGLPDHVVARARDLAGSEQVSLERLLADLRERNLLLEEQVVLQTQQAEQAVSQRRLVESRLEALTLARDEIRSRALSEADRILGEANREVERAVREIRESQARPEAVREVRERLEERKASLGRERRRSERRTSSRARTPASSNVPLQTGDRVTLGPGGPAGEIIEIKGSEAVVAMGPAHSRVKLVRLVKVGGPSPQRVHVSAPRVELTTARMRIDLRGKRALEAVAEVERFLDEALSGGLNRAEILHGKGTGALRSSIHEYLEGRPDIAGFEEAPIEQGGAGITIVSF